MDVSCHVLDKTGPLPQQCDILNYVAGMQTKIDRVLVEADQHRDYK